MIGPHLRLLYGDVRPVPEIPGHEVISGKRLFVVAKQGEQRFYVGQAEGGYRLFPLDEVGRMRADRALFVQAAEGLTQSREGAKEGAR